MFCVLAQKLRPDSAGSLPAQLRAPLQVVVTDGRLATECLELCHLAFPSVRRAGLPGPARVEFDVAKYPPWP